jgi:glycosyltransferase involved in cell wall biosynthesis
MTCGTEKVPMRPDGGPIALSIIIPFYDEAENIENVVRSVLAVLGPLPLSSEVILIDDCSRDGTAAIARRLAAENPSIKVIEFVRNFGQTAAMMAGIDHARGDVIVAMDGDGQNDPEDIPILLGELEKGFDVASGWRKERKDRTLSRRVPSFVANALVSLISGVHLHDYGCSLKAYRRDVIKNVRLYGEMHRFIPIYTHWNGGRVAEVPVRHHPRRYGKSKYGLNRIIKVLLDLLLVRFLDRYATKPIHVFGTFGVLSVVASFGIGVWMLWLKLVDGVSFISTPLPLLAVFLFSTGVIGVLMGLLAELLVRTWFESQDRRIYTIKSTTNLP